MARYIHSNGDTIQTFEKGKFVVTRSGVEQTFDVSHWGKNPESHIDGDIRTGYYAGFRKVVESELN
jgi:hypothetical protein